MVRSNSCFHDLKHGINERKKTQGSIELIVQKNNINKKNSKNKSITLEEVASIVGWTHSMNARTAGHKPFKLLTAHVIKLVIL